MARKVKCNFTKEVGYNNEFFLAENGKYYKNEETYNKECEESELHLKIVDMFSTLLGYYDDGQFNAQAMKELSSLRKTYKYQDIYDTFKEYYHSLEIILPTKAGMSDYHKAKYIFALIRNKINDIMDKNNRMIKSEKHMKEKTIDIDILNNKSTNTVKKSDISQFLDY